MPLYTHNPYDPSKKKVVSTTLQDQHAQYLQRVRLDKLPVQYLQSVGIADNNPDGGKTTTYFFPSMVFPTYIEICSVTILYKNNSSTDKIIHFATAKGSEIPADKTLLTHKANDMITTVVLEPSVILDPHQPFFFYHPEELEDSCIVLGYRSYNGNFGNRLKTPL